MPDPAPWLAVSWTTGLAVLLLAYLLGSVPFGLLLTRAAGLSDIRRIGSGNIGATNVLRTGRKDLAAATVLLDGGKGLAAVLLARWLAGADAAMIAALGAVLGHLFPLWLGFKGGKGVATTLGVLLGLSFWVGALCCATWLLVAFLLRYSSLAALAATLLAPLYAWLLVGDWRLVVTTALLAALVWARHHQNIARLLRGEEAKINLKKG